MPDSPLDCCHSRTCYSLQIYTCIWSSENMYMYVHVRKSRLVMVEELISWKVFPPSVKHHVCVYVQVNKQYWMLFFCRGLGLMHAAKKWLDTNPAQTHTHTDPHTSHMYVCPGHSNYSTCTNIRRWGILLVSDFKASHCIPSNFFSNNSNFFCNFLIWWLPSNSLIVPTKRSFLSMPYLNEVV